MNITMEPEVLVATITIVAGLTIFSFLKSRHIERMQQLEKGIAINQSNKSYLEIKFGLLFMGIGAGILLAFILNQTVLTYKNEIYPALIFLFGGLGLVTSFFVVQNLQKK